MPLAVTAILCSYNAFFAQKLQVDCPCYKKKYSNDDDASPFSFVHNVINRRGSYMACLCYKAGIRHRVKHTAFPILLGSDIDAKIRGLEAVEETWPLWSVMIMDGQIIILEAFSTYNALSMHPREFKSQIFIDWYTYCENSGLALNFYSLDSVKWTFNKEIGTDLDTWMSLLARSNPFEKLGAEVSSSEYIQMLETVLKTPYSMNTLSCRQCLSCSAILSRYLENDLAKRRKNKPTGNMRANFESGRSIYYNLSRGNTFELEDKCRNYPQNYNTTLHEGRSNKIAHIASNIKRATNAAVKNSNALLFPEDGVGYLCPLSTKDLKSAGEQSTLTDNTITNGETNHMDLFNYLMREFRTAKHDSNRTAPLYHVAINGYLLKAQFPWNIHMLVKVKRKFPHVTTQYYFNYVHFSTLGNVLIKYSQEHDAFFSPAETTKFGITYPSMDYFSITARELSYDALIRNPAAKSTVSINNIKGSVAMVTSPLHKKLIQNALGTTCYMEITQAEIEEIPKYAIMSSGHSTEQHEHFANKAEAAYQIHSTPELESPEDKETDPLKARKALDRLYPAAALLFECRKISNQPYDKIYNDSEENIARLQSYRSLIFSSKFYYANPIWNLKLFASFNNLHGNCNEDGVVLDYATAERLKPIIYRACITVECTFGTTKQPHDSRFLKVAADMRTFMSDSDLVIGVLVSAHPVTIKHSKHTVIRSFYLPGQYISIIEFLPKETNMYNNLEVDYIYKNKSVVVIIKGECRNRLNVGSKLANAYGQKNIISALEDLSDHWGVTKRGEKVRAQIFYNPNSFMGRMVAGQMHEMLKSPDVAFGPHGEILAPIYHVIHSIHPYINEKIITVKNDTLTNTNGFDTQNLSFVSNYLRSTTVHDRVLQVMGFIGYDVSFLTPENFFERDT